MKLYLSKHRYGTGKNYVAINPETLAPTAISYSWWKYVTVDSVGNVIFLNSYYSSTTSRHQSETKRILMRLGIPINLQLNYAQRGLDTNYLDHAIDDEITAIRKQCDELADAICTKGARKKTNAYRWSTINNNEYTIKDLIRFKTEYLDKKKFVVPHAAKWLCGRWTDETREERKKLVTPLFLKSNGKIQTNELNQYALNQDQSRRENWDTILGKDSKISLLWDGLKVEQLRLLNLYEFCIDLENQIPVEHSDEYLALHKFIRRDDVAFSLYSLDRMHTWLTNKQTLAARKSEEREPKVESVFPYSPIVNLIQVPENRTLTILDTPSKLRREGKNQGHCIGGASYIADCKRGYIALNYAGYTFYFSRDLQLISTSGKYNSATPQNLRAELVHAVAAAKIEAASVCQLLRQRA